MGRSGCLSGVSHSRANHRAVLVLVFSNGVLGRGAFTSAPSVERALAAGDRASGPSCRVAF